MARTVDKEAYAAKRNEILDVALRLVYAKGYEKMTVQDILSELSMSSGAFYHYFDTKPAVLEALVERMQQISEQPLLRIIHDPHLSAIEKLQGFFDTLDRLRIAQKTSVVELLRVWYTDDNAIVRQKADETFLKHRAPLLTEIVRQGIREGVFTTTYPGQAGEVILSLLHGMAITHSRFLLSLEQERNERRCIEGIVTTHAAYMDALERVLGAPPNSIHRIDAELVKVWVSALTGED
jgi:AcrR family transcriptional regulator